MTTPKLFELQNRIDQYERYLAVTYGYDDNVMDFRGDYWELNFAIDTLRRVVETLQGYGDSSVLNDHVIHAVATISDWND